jgi:uncharacterized membrane protein
MIVLITFLLISVALVVLLTFLLGFRLGGQSWITQVQRVRAEAAEAERQLYDLTRAAFVAMAEEAERRRMPPSRREIL